jgi:hypothetical protein
MALFLRPFSARMSCAATGYSALCSVSSVCTVHRSRIDPCGL